MDCGLIGSGYYAVKLIKILLKNDFSVKYVLTYDGKGSSLLRHCMKSQIPVYDVDHFFKNNVETNNSEWLFSINNDKIIPEAVIRKFSW